MKTNSYKKEFIEFPLGKKGGSGLTLISLTDYERVNEMGTWSYDPSTGYVAKHIQNKKTGIRRKLYLHRFIKNLNFGDGLIVDHYDGDPLNNTQDNLRIVTAAENSQNRRAVEGKSIYRGVYFDIDANRWVGRVRTTEVSWKKTFKNEWKAAKETNWQRLQLMPFAKPDPNVMAELYAQNDNEMIEKITFLINTQNY